MANAKTDASLPGTRFLMTHYSIIFSFPQPE